MSESAIVVKRLYEPDPERQAAALLVLLKKKGAGWVQQPAADGPLSTCKSTHFQSNPSTAAGALQEGQ